MKHYSKAGSLIAIDHYIPIVQLNYGLYNRKTYSVLTVSSFVKPFKDMGHIIRRNTVSIVYDGYLNLLTGLAAAQGNRIPGIS